jgi:hypothetical protein
MPEVWRRALEGLLLFVVMCTLGIVLAACSQEWEIKGETSGRIKPRPLDYDDPPVLLAEENVPIEAQIF